MPLGSGTTGVRRLEIEHEGTLVRAVFRHVDEYEKNLRMRDDQNYAGFYDRYSAECAAYELGRMLGLDMIPPAVLRRVGGDRGSVQLWVEDSMTAGDRNERGLQPPDNGHWRRQQAVMRVFDALIAKSGRNTGNRLIDEDWNLWLIDHSRAFQTPRGDTSFATVNQIPVEFWPRSSNSTMTRSGIDYATISTQHSCARSRSDTRNWWRTSPTSSTSVGPAPYSSNRRAVRGA